MRAAKATKQDEFYTQLSDIEKELRHYSKEFEGKTVLCNCDDPRISNFFHYFSFNFEKLKLKKLITTCYKNQNSELFSTNAAEKAVFLEYKGDKNQNRVPDPSEIGVHNFKGDGDFRSGECMALLKEADIVVTNPPFSLFREYISQLAHAEKKFLIIGNVNAVSYKECFELIKGNKMWLGYNCTRHFARPDGSMFETARSFWYTNLDTEKRHQELVLFRSYDPTLYPVYDNYDAIEVSKAVDIPMDFDGVMGVPITFLDKYNPEQFEILGITDRGNEWGLKTREYTREDVPNPGDLNRRAAIKIGTSYKATYARLLIKRKP
ncbi:MAG: adenine-specific methyltransferase EcoRI family protein [Undibacterium sp.]